MTNGEKGTTKNNLTIAEMIRLVRESDVIDRTDGSVLAKAFNYLFDKYIENPATKNESGVDCISRQEAIDTIRQLYLDLASQKAVIDILKVLPTVTPISKECIDYIAEDKTFDKMDRVKQLLNNDKLDDWEVLKKIGEVVEE